MQGHTQSILPDARQQPQCRPQVAFHIAHTPPICAGSLNTHRERVRVPDLPLHGYHVGVPRNNNAPVHRAVGCRDGDEKVGPCAVFTVAAVPSVPVAGKFGLNVVNNV